MLYLKDKQFSKYQKKIQVKACKYKVKNGRFS
jgi:hypothetical protein